MAQHILVALAVALVAVAAQDPADDPAVAAGCSRVFTREMRPVCSSDGTIHNNPSIFEYHQCVERTRGRELTRMPMIHCDPAFDDTQDL